MRVLVTGARGFIGRHLTAALSALDGVELYAFDRDTPRAQLDEWCMRCDFVYHLAGVYRPETQEDFMRVNYGLTETLLKTLVRYHNTCPVMFASCAQAALSSLYGKSKKAGEELVMQYGRETGAPVYVFRLPTVFGKWAKPNHACPVATLCYNTARALPVPPIDPSAVLHLVHIDSVIDALMCLPADECQKEGDYCVVPDSYITDMQTLKDTVAGFSSLRETGSVPDLGDPLTRKLFATYQSYLPTMDFAYPLDMHEDGYGSMSRFLSTPDRGQVGVNVMRAGVDEGEHWHNSRSERHLVVSGTGAIRLKKPGESECIEYRVSGQQHMVVEIPAGYVHAVVNTGETDLIDLVWSSDCWDPENPDVFA